MMFDGFMSVLIEDVMRTPQTRDEAAYRRRFYGESDTEQSKRTREFLPRFLRRNKASGAA